MCTYMEQVQDIYMHIRKYNMARLVSGSLLTALIECLIEYSDLSTGHSKDLGGCGPTKPTLGSTTAKYSVDK